MVKKKSMSKRDKKLLFRILKVIMVILFLVVIVGIGLLVFKSQGVLG